MAAPQQQQALPGSSRRGRGPLAHIIDALRLDNHQLLLETLHHDPRFDNNIDDHHNAAEQQQQHASTATASRGNQQQQRQNQEQLLIFGSADLRRVILRHVMDQSSQSSDNNSKKKVGAGNRKNNATMMEEEELIIKQWNEELKTTLPASNNSDARQSSHANSSTAVTQIVGTQILSPSSNGSVVSPYDSTIATITQPPISSATNITYVLRGGGFDLPSLSAAALHRRNILLQQQQQIQLQQKHHQADASSSRLFRFLFVPRITEMERAFLNEMGVVADDDKGTKISSAASINSFESLPIDLIPLDEDVLSLELTGGRGGYGSSSGSGGGSGGAADQASDNRDYTTGSAASLRHSSVEGCEADVADIVARSLIKLQLLSRGGSIGGNDVGSSRSSGGGIISGEKEEEVLFSSSLLRGAIPRVQGLGPLATAVIDRMMTLRLEEERMEAEMDEMMMEGEDNEAKLDVIIDDDGMEVTDGGKGRRRRQDDEEIMNSTMEEGVEIATMHNRGNEVLPSSTTALPQIPSIQALLVIDRRIDLVTPMLTPLTYEGLIDDVLQIQVGGYVSVKKSIVEPDDEKHTNNNNNDQQQMVLLPLNDSDPLYAEVRDKHVESFGSFLQNQAKALKESHSQFTNRETARDLTEIHQFVKQIPVFTRNLRSLTNHIHIAELVKSAAEATAFRQRWQTERSMLESEPCYEVLEDLIASGSEPPYRWLRLFCLQSLTSNGIKAARYDSLRRDVIQTYGYEYLMVLNDLERAGFLRKKETFVLDSMATPYSTLRKALNLINPDVDPSNPQDASYVSSGYAPMTVRWIEAAMRGYAGLDEALKELPVGSGMGGGGRWVDVMQRWPPESLVEALKRKRGPNLGALAKQWSEWRDGSRSRMSTDGLSMEEKPVLLVYFVGGVTFMELAAMRYLSRRPSFPYNIVCCTTEIVNGGTLLKSLSC
ncbi:hypothetical protein ACHAXH_004681 [Discostella pseudostelligera]